MSSKQNPHCPENCSPTWQRAISTAPDPRWESHGGSTYSRCRRQHADKASAIEKVPVTHYKTVYTAIIIQLAYGFHPCVFRAPIPLAEGPPPPPTLDQSVGEAREAGVAPRDNLPPSPTAPGRIGPIPVSGIFPYIYIYNSDTPWTQIELSRVDTARQGVETPILRADR